MRTLDVMRSLILCSAVTLLVACGGGGDSPSSAPTPPAATDGVPASASSSVQGLVDYLQSLVKAAADTLEPLSLASFSPVTSETEEPRKID